MKRICVRLSLFAFCLVTGANAQMKGAQKPRTPLKMDSSYFRNLKSTPKHMKFNLLSASANAALSAATGQAPDPIVSIPHFSSFFSYQNQVFPFTMMGHAPQRGGTTKVDTQYVPISFSFDEYVNQNGNNIVIDATTITDEIKESPNFERASYSTGFTQFGDAVQRAEFFKLIQGQPSGEDGWHTILKEPKTLTPVTVEVPFGSSILFTDDAGNFFAVIDINFLTSQLNTLLQTEGLETDNLSIFLTRNSVFVHFADFDTPVDCCFGGFHGAFETKQVGNKHLVQVFAFATSLDSIIAEEAFGDPTAFADVYPLSHELSESMNDPFVNNFVPPWQFPNNPPGLCSNLLETGDPVAAVTAIAFPVTLHGFTYHPQPEALLQWFSREAPSSAVGGAYSYPDTTILTSPSQPCPVEP